MFLPLCHPLRPGQQRLKSRPLKNRHRSMLQCFSGHPVFFFFGEGFDAGSDALQYEKGQGSWMCGCSCNSPRCHDTVMEDVASCAAPLPSPTVLPQAEPPELLGISSFILLFLHLVHLVLPLLPLVFFVV